MKETKSRKEQTKLALIPLLLVVLAAVLFWPESAPKGSAQVPQLVTTVSVATPQKNASIGAGPRADASWPSLDLSHVTAVNPFAKSMAIKEMLGELPEEKPAAEAVATDAEKQQTAAEKTDPSETPLSSPAVPPAPPKQEIIDVATIATLQAIIDSDRGRSALIDSRIFRVGDTLNDEYRIVDISPTAVSVEWVGPKENGESMAPSP